MTMKNMTTLQPHNMKQKLTGIVQFGIVAIIFGSLSFIGSAVGQSFDPTQGILLRGTVVTMDAAGTILHNGNVLVRNGRIVATWNGARIPDGTPVGNAFEVDLGPKTLIFPG